MKLAALFRQVLTRMSPVKIPNLIQSFFNHLDASPCLSSRNASIPFARIRIMSN